MRFLVDNQLPPSLARWLRDRGHDAEHVFESGLHLLDDRALWARALIDARIVGQPHRQPKAPTVSIAGVDADC